MRRTGGSEARWTEIGFVGSANGGSPTKVNRRPSESPKGPSRRLAPLFDELKVDVTVNVNVREAKERLSQEQQEVFFDCLRQLLGDGK